MITENLSTLKIHKLTQAQYDRELAAGRIDENAIYLTPDKAVDLSGYATVSDIENHNTSEAAHGDIREAVSAVSTLVGDTAVSTQINNAIAGVKLTTTSDGVLVLSI